MRTVERDSAEWDIAWERLRDSGRDITAWMLMHAEGSGILSVYAFKHIDTRRYVRILRFC